MSLKSIFQTEVKSRNSTETAPENVNIMMTTIHSV